MSNNREIIAHNIAERFIDEISGNNKEQILEYNPEDRVYVGKLSPKSKEDTFSSSVLIKQIGVDFRIPKNDIDVAELCIYPKGNFFFRVIPTFAQQRWYFLREFNVTFKSKYKTEQDLFDAYNAGTLTSEMITHKVQLLPVYEKIALDRAEVAFKVNVGRYYNKKYNCGNIPQDDVFYRNI